MIQPSRGCGGSAVTALSRKLRPGRKEQSRRLALRLFAPVLVLGLLFAAPVAAHAGKSEPGVLRARLKNGLRVVIVRNTLAPVVTTEINYLVGSNEAPEGFPGMAHAQEHMMFRGSPGLTADQLADITAQMGGDFDADTQQTVTQYFFTVPSEDLDVALHIGAIRMRGVNDSQKLWEKERGAIEQEVSRDNSSPMYVFYTKLLKAMFKGTPYAHDALGTRPSFDKTTGEMLSKFHDAWYAPNNAILIVVGNVNPHKTLKEITSLFGTIPARKIPKRPAVKLQPVKAESLNLKTDQPYGISVVSFRMPGYRSPDFAAAQILSDVLASKRGNIYSLAAQGKALYATFQLAPLPQSGLGFAFAVFPKGGNGAGLVGLVKQQLEAVVKNGVSPDLVAAAKRHELASAEFQKNSVSGLAQAWSQTLAVEGRQSPQDDIDALKAVTVADVNRAAKRYLDETHAITAVLTPQQSGKPVAHKGFGGAESFAPTKTHKVPLPGWAEKALKRLAVPKTVIHPKATTLPNGIHLIVQPEAVSNTISIYGVVKHKADLETQKGQEGVDDVLARLFDWGSTSLNRVAFQKALDSIGADESAGTSFSLQVLAPHFEKGVQLLAENELHPALPGRAFQIVKMQTARAVAGQLKSPGYLTQRALQKALVPAGDPTLRQATPKTVLGLTLADVKAYYSKVFRPDETTIVVIGKVTPQKAEEVIRKYFGAWKSTGPKPPTQLAPIPANKPSTVAVPDSSRLQDSVYLSENLELKRSNPDYYALQLGNRVLGGGFYATRLYRDLREKSGLVYTVASRFDIGKTRSTYQLFYGCDPDKVSSARKLAVRDLEAMAKEPVSAEELTQAKAMALRAIPLSESSVSYVAHGLLHRAVMGLPLDEPTVAAHRYMKMTAAQIKAAYAKWLQPSRLVQVTQGPAPK